MRETLCLFLKPTRTTTGLFLERTLLTADRRGDRKRVENKIPVERSRRVLAVTKRGVIKREELVEERNRREGKDARFTIRRQQSTKISQIPGLSIAVFLG